LQLASGAVITVFASAWLDRLLAVCKESGMTNGKQNPVITQLRQIGVSGPYASQLTTGARKPSLRLAIKIFREVGLKLGPLEGLDAKEIRTLEAAHKLGMERVA
jgi:hypothetical protein